MPEFHFWESDWGTHAMKGGKITTVAALTLGVLGFFFWSFLGAIYSVAVGLFLASFELPVVYKCFEQCRRWEDNLNESLYFRVPAVRGVCYLGLSFLMFFFGGWQILTGIFMLMTATLYFFTQVIGATLTDGTDGTTSAPGGGGEGGGGT
ncbi:unnamed protein product, partial [Discosporangium mesarthrocarpum]